MSQDEKGRELVKVTEDALAAAIGVCAPGRPFKLIGKTIHELLRGTKYSVSTQFTGHGIGRDFHCPPWILHHCQCFQLVASKLVTEETSVNDDPGVMQPGHCFTIEVNSLVHEENIARELIYPRTSRASYKVPIQDHGYFPMDGQRQRRCVLSSVPKEVSDPCTIELRS